MSQQRSIIISGNNIARAIALTLLTLSALTLPGRVFAQDSTALAAVTAMERLITEAIERAEKSVVAIARVRRQGDQPSAPEALSLIHI